MHFSTARGDQVCGEEVVVCRMLTTTTNDNDDVDDDEKMMKLLLFMLFPWLAVPLQFTVRLYIASVASVECFSGLVVIHFTPNTRRRRKVRVCCPIESCAVYFLVFRWRTLRGVDLTILRNSKRRERETDRIFILCESTERKKKRVDYHYQSVFQSFIGTVPPPPPKKLFQFKNALFPEAESVYVWTRKN